MQLFIHTALLFFILSLPVHSQDLMRARLTIDSLCSPGLHGRGPALQGDSIAAFYLKQKFEFLKLKKFTENHFQYFHYNVNVFTGPVSLSMGKNQLTTGKDFILHPASLGGKGTLSIIKLDSNIFNKEKSLHDFFKKKLKDKAILFPSSYLKRIDRLPQPYLSQFYQAGCLVEVIEKKLTASITSQQYPCPYFQVLKEAVPSKLKKLTFEVEARLLPDYTSRNILGYIPAAIATDSFIVISAHYDHLGMMGTNSFFPGANDNASGVTMMLELAHYFSTSEVPLKFNILFIAFAAEEVGLLGSKYYTEHPFFPLSKIKFLINLDLMGTGDDGIMTVNGSIHPKEFQVLEEINQKNDYLPAIKKRGKAANSDHYFFSEKKVPAFFFYTLGGTAAYHDMYDRAETLPLTRFREVFQLLRDFIQKF